MAERYSAQTITGYNATPPPDDGTTGENNRTTWAKHKSKLGDPIKELAEDINTQLLSLGDDTVLDTAGARTTIAADYRRTINVTAAGTQSLGDAATLAIGYWTTIRNSHTAAISVTVITGTDTLDGTAGGSVLIAPGGALTFIVNTSADGYLSLNSGVLNEAVLNESANHLFTPAATKGIVWVKNDDPNTLMFTDDTGQDYVVTRNHEQFVVKTADETINSSTTLQDDDDLQVTLEANETYEIEVTLLMRAGNTTPDIKTQLLESDGIFSGLTFDVAVTSTVSEATGAVVNALNSTSVITKIYKVVAVASGAGGVFKVQWAQNVSNAADTTVKKGSWIRALKLRNV